MQEVNMKNDIWDVIEDGNKYVQYVQDNFIGKIYMKCTTSYKLTIFRLTQENFKHLNSPIFIKIILGKKSLNCLEKPSHKENSRSKQLHFWNFWKHFL